MAKPRRKQAAGPARHHRDAEQYLYGGGGHKQRDSRPRPRFLLAGTILRGQFPEQLEARVWIGGDAERSLYGELCKQ